jgi:hypothetical protein
LRFTGDLFVSIVSLNAADLTGRQGLVTSIIGRRIAACTTLGAPDMWNINKNSPGEKLANSMKWTGEICEILFTILTSSKH